MKKRIFAISMVLICLSVLASTTLAYFTDLGIARNVITSAGLDIALVEQQNGVYVPHNEEKFAVMPSMEIDKIVAVQNLEQPAWIRTSISVTVYDQEKTVLEIPADTLRKMIIIEPSPEYWTEKDGWWYYNTAAGVGEFTAPLFEKIVFSGPNMDNKYQSCTMVVTVDAQAVQQANNGSSVLEAAGWPAVAEE